MTLALVVVLVFLLPDIKRVKVGNVEAEMRDNTITEGSDLPPMQDRANEKTVQFIKEISGEESTGGPTEVN